MWRWQRTSITTWFWFGNNYIVRVPNNGCNGTTGRRWYAIVGGEGIGHFRNRGNAKAAVLKALALTLAL